jgi:hypothetical protein
MTKCAIGIKSIHLLIRSDSPASPVIPRHQASPSNAGINEARKTLASRGKISMLQPETGLVALDDHVRQGRKAQEYQERQL